MSYSYSEHVEAGQAYLTVKLNLNEPIEIGDFAAHFAGLGSEFDNYIALNHPSLKGHAQMYVREVRHGSIIADIFAQIGTLIDVMDGALIIGGFGALFNKRIRNFVTGGFLPDATKAQLNNIYSAIGAVAKDRNGSLEIEETTFENGTPVKQIIMRLSSEEARQAQKTIEHQKNELDAETHVDYERVLMVFERPSKSYKSVGKSTGERVLIEEISTSPKSLVYGSIIAEDRIKHEMLNSDDNIFKLGFVCDVNVKTRSGRVVAYSVTHVNQVIDLPDED